MNYNKAPLQTGGYVRCQCPSRAGDPAHTGSMKGHNKPNGLHAGGRPALLFHGVDAAIERGIAGLCRPRVLSARSAPPPDPADRGRHQPRRAAPPAAGVARMISPQAISTRIREAHPALRGPAGPAAGVRAFHGANNSGLTCVFLLLDPRPAGNPGTPPVSPSFQPLRLAPPTPEPDR